MKLHIVVPAAAALGLLAGCGLFGDDKPETAKPADASAFPNLATVPEEAPPSTPKVERAALIQGLQADRANAEYTEEKLGEETANVAPAAPPPPGPPKPEAPPEAAADDAESEEAAAEPAPEAAPKEVAALPADLGEAIALIYFGETTAELTDHDRAILADVASLYVRQRGSRVRVIGHASGNERAAEGATETDLAQARAEQVAQTLISLGVPATALETSSGGAKYDESSPNGVAANRRVEIYLGS